MATEIEIKRLLDADGYAQLRARLDALATPHIHEQVNHYLDLTDAALNEAGAMLRLRVVGERMVLTLKARASVEGGILRTQELEHELTTPADRLFWRTWPIAWREAAVWISDWLQTTGLHALTHRDGTLQEVGSTENLRLAYKLVDGIPGWPHPLTLELDMTRFPGGVVRWELECEDPESEALVPFLAAWLTSFGVNTVAATETKYAQFLRLAARPSH